jgi:hypothetical protein
VPVLPWLRVFSSSFHSIATSPKKNLALSTASPTLHSMILCLYSFLCPVRGPLIDEIYGPNENKILVSRRIMTKSGRKSFNVACER